VRGAACLLLGLGLAYGAPARADPEPEIVVTGQKSTRPARDPTVAATLVDQAELARPGASAALILAHVPGVQVSATGAASELATASVRGASSAQTPVYLAGIRLNDDVTGTADLSLVPLWMLSRAEVYRGNAPADADRLGIGGAVYFEPRLPRKTRVGAGATLGSFGERAGFVGAELAEGGDGALVAFRGSAAQNDYPYLDDNGTASPADDRTRIRRNADYTAREAWAIGRSTLGARGARITTVFNAFDREQGISGISAVPALSARAESARVLVGLSAKVPCSADPSCLLELTTQGISAHSRLSDPRRELGLLVERLDSEGTRVGESARLTYAGRVLTALFGANIELERLALDGGAPLRATRSTSSVRLGLTANVSGHTLLSALGVVTCDKTHGPLQANECADLTPEGRLGVRERWGPFELRTNLGRYARVPTLGELYGVSALVRGSSALVPEQGVTWDLGARWEAPLGPVTAYFDAFGFARRVSELIAYRRSSLGAVQPYNVGSARVLGAELEAGATWARHARSSLSLTALDPRETTPGRSLTNDLVPYQSRLVSSVFLEGFVEPRARVFERAGLDARLSYRASRLADPAGLIVLPAATELDLGAALLLVHELSLRFAVDDVLDAHRFDFIGYPVPGRSFHLALEAWW
jgi:vitamin B12 transporter